MTCGSCGTRIEAEYEPCGFCRLSPSSAEFLKTFVRSRGNIKEVERELGIPYTAARSKLADLIEELGYDSDISKPARKRPTRE